MNKIKKLSLIAFLICLKAFGQTAATPVFSPAGGTFSGSVTVTVTDSTPGALIFCTIDGSTPDISSPVYSGPFVFHATTPLNCIAAVAGVNQKNAQNNNPNAPGTYWKHPPNCKCTGTACAVTTGAGCQADDPGGSGIPSDSTHNSGIASPSLSGASMVFGEVAQPGAQTNILFPPGSSFGGCDGCVDFLETHDYFWPSPILASANEDDSELYDKTHQLRYSAGGQYCFVGCPGGSAGWDVGGNSNVPWTNIHVTAGGTGGVWHHYQKLVHRDLAEIVTTPCSSKGAWPFVYLKFLRIDGVTFNNGGPGWSFCANALPATWNRAITMQAQIDIANHSTATSYKYYWDNINFLSTYPSSPNKNATYTLGSVTTTTFSKFGGTGTIGGKSVIQ